MHEHKRRRVMGSKRGGTYARAIVMGMLSRDSKQVRARGIHDIQGETLKSSSARTWALQRRSSPMPRAATWEVVSRFVWKREVAHSSGW